MLHAANAGLSGVPSGAFAAPRNDFTSQSLVCATVTPSTSARHSLFQGSRSAAQRVSVRRQSRQASDVEFATSKNFASGINCGTSAKGDHCRPPTAKNPTVTISTVRQFVGAQKAPAGRPRVVNRGMERAASSLLPCSACGAAPQPCCGNETCLQKGALCDIKHQECAVATATCGEEYGSCCAGYQCAVPYQCYRPDGVCMTEHIWFLETELWLLAQS